MNLKRQTIQAQTGIGFQLKKGQLLKVIDPLGEQVSDLFCYSQLEPWDALSSGRTIDTCDTILFTRGHTLYSQSGKAMLEILEDTCGRHDFLVTPCSQQMFEMISGKPDYHPSCFENLKKAFQSFEVNPDQISTSFNIFMNVPIQADGKISVQAPLSKAGDFVIFQAKMDLIVGLTACSDEGTNNGSCKPIEFEIFDHLRAEIFK